MMILLVTLLSTEETFTQFVVFVLGWACIWGSNQQLEVV